MNSLILVLALFAAAEPEAKPLDSLILIRQNAEMLEKLRQNGMEVDPDGKHLKELVWQADKLTNGKIKTYEDLLASTGGDHATASAFERAVGWFTFLHVIMVLAVIMVLFAVIGLFGHYFLALILLVPPSIWSVATWAICFGLVYQGQKLGDDYLWLVLPGCGGMIGCCLLIKSLYARELDNDTWAYSAILAAIWGVIAMQYGSHFIGFMAVMALMSAMGFVAGHFPGVVFIGFEREDVIPRATGAAALILAAHVWLIVTGNTTAQLEVFREGMGFMGPFIAYLGLLIMSSKWYWWDSNGTNMSRYLPLQAVTVAAGALALWFGTVYHINMLLGVGGTFFSLYLLEKYCEIPWKGVGYLWAALGLGGILYGFTAFAKLHPELFFMG